MPPPLLQLSDIDLSFGGANLLEGADLVVSPGERLCLVGRNGSGKSTLLRIAAGLIEPDRGSLFRQPGARIRYLAQEPDFSSFATSLAFVQAGLGPDDPPYRAAQILRQLGLSGEEDPRQLSGGEARRVALAQALAGKTDILLFDEPTNHLDLPTIEWLEAELASCAAALVLISHDRRFLANLTNATLWLDRGRTRRLDQGFAGFEAWRDGVLAEEELNQHKLGRKIAEEEHWLRYGVTARRKRNVRRLEGLLALRGEKREHRRAQGKAALAASEAEASGSLVIEAKGLNLAFDGRPIVKDFSIRVQRGDRIGIVGPNGSGKTSLMRLLTGLAAADSGMSRRGSQVEMVVLEQDRGSLDPEMSLADALSGGSGDQVLVNGQPRHVIGYMKDFLFAPEQARSPLKVLSGGERGRLLLARALAKPSNLLVLDEPTNDLDLETLDVLEEMLADYPGTILMISHDRDFLDSCVTRLIAPEGNGTWRDYAGGYSQMRLERAAIAPPAPRRPVQSPAPAAAAAARPAKKQLGFKEKHLLETLPEKIEKLQSIIQRLNAKLADPELYARNPAAFAEASALLSKAQDELAAQEETWLKLEILREEIELGS